ncbi:uncharacterized protein [Rutidosis leptorrhynchoides]|uniref:uncharacterized protein n=1 Tax=Rutidosis leptorrhynchoides TaxID=125765 RepID=UPI003A99934F
MAAGLGYGANMLTRYLAQVGQNTPLIAAACLDNFFDLKAADQSSHLTQGLIKILQYNKELFQGRFKGFDVEKALQAKSLKDFDEAISMVSYGFDSIDEFYASSSTTDMIGNVKIPVLFVQNNAAPSFSVPRSLIAKNPLTSWLICKFLSDDKRTTVTSSVSWCQQLVTEWLTAVELGILKGRHPLTEDSEESINPSKRLKLIASKASDVNNKSNHLSNLPQLYENTSQMPTSVDKNINGSVAQTNVVDSTVVKEIDVEPVNSETEKVVPAAEVVMNMLDVTMPEALSEEQKLKVKTAVARGETLMNALQDAVPDDVRGKLTTAVTAILEKQKNTVNAPDVKSLLSNQGKKPKAPEVTKKDTAISNDANTAATNNVASEIQAHTPGTDDSSQSQSASHHETSANNNQDADTSAQVKSGHEDETKVDEDKRKKEDNDAHISPEKIEESQLMVKKDGENVKKDESSSSPAVPINGSSNSSSFSVDNDAQISTEKIEEGQSMVKKDGENMKKDESSSPAVPVNGSSNSSSFSVDNDAQISTEKIEESSSSSENQLMVKKDGENVKRDESSSSPAVPVNGSSNSSSFSVTQALDALTGMDDSTQVAVNSVFSVIEDVITQMEENKDDESEIGDKDKVDDTDTDPKTVSGLQQNEDGECKLMIDPKKLRNASSSKLSVNNEDETLGFNNTRKRPYRNTVDPDDASELSLDYVPEEGQWKLLELEQSGNGRNSNASINVKSPVECNMIEPAYVILDEEGDCGSVREHEKIRTEDKIGDTALAVKENILKTLSVEVFRKLQATDMEDMTPVLRKELEVVANTISLALVHGKQQIIYLDGEKVVGPGNLQAEDILDVVSSAVNGTEFMKEVIPVDVVVCSILASMRKMFNKSAADSIVTTDVCMDTQRGNKLQARLNASDKMPLDNVNQNDDLYSEDDEYEDNHASSTLGRDTVMAGAVTAAIGASSLFIHQQDSFNDGLKSSFENRHEDNDETSKNGEGNNIVTSLAEKAMSVAAPVVPMKEGGQVDQDRLVALLTDLGQRGGILKLVGKVALLWGGIRGAMSLIGKLFTFLRLSERPLLQRILGFVSLVLVLWTPVVVPLLPTLVQNWASHSSSKFTELACIIGLYTSITVLVVLWGKRIRGYEDPLETYGLKLTSATQIQNVVYGLIGGVVLVMLIQFTNVLFGFACVSWHTVPSFTDAITVRKMFGELFRYAGQGFIMTLSVALVEELLFRSWLAEEIATDLGYNQGIILSGLAFSLSQWSPKAIPGLWLLSLGLTGIKHRLQGSLSVPIGLRTGIMASSFFIKEGGFLIYQPTYPLWVTGGDPFQPFNGIVGLAVALLWAINLYPRKHQENTKITTN